MQISSNLNPYWLLLRDLSTDEKLSLIEWLVKSLQAMPPTPNPKKARRTVKKDDNWVQHFAGSWNDFPETAEEMIALTEGARTASRPVDFL